MNRGVALVADALKASGITKLPSLQQYFTESESGDVSPLLIFTH